MASRNHQGKRHGYRVTGLAGVGLQDRVPLKESSVRGRRLLDGEDDWLEDLSALLQPAQGLLELCHLRGTEVDPLDHRARRVVRLDPRDEVCGS